MLSSRQLARALTKAYDILRGKGKCWPLFLRDRTTWGWSPDVCCREDGWILLGHTWQPTPVLICSCWSVLETPRELTAHPFSHPHLALHLWTLPAVFVPVSVPSLWESPGPVSFLLFLMHWPLHVCPQSLFLLGLAHYTSWKFLFLWSFHPGKLSMAEMGNGCSKGI